MKLLLLLLLAALGAAYARVQIRVGTYSLATEAGWSAAFELRKDGSAVVTPAFDTEGEDGSRDLHPTMRRIPGAWREVHGGIEITYAGKRDRFSFEEECRNYPGHPCFRFQGSLDSSSAKSLLKHDQPYINWDWNNHPKKPDVGKCRSDCEKMRSEGSLKRGTSLDECIAAICK